jgi:CRISPR/Cas system CSM-associated protein Csm3 (group 7 of RAMP superfamily)
MILRGKLYAESPIYRGNARKTLFTRDGDGTQRLVSLAGEVGGTAEALMDAFIGSSTRGRNKGLLDRLWLRLFSAPLPQNLIRRVDCRLREDCYPKQRFFDLRMGIRLDEDRWAAKAGANYKMETLFRNSVFDLSLDIDESLLGKAGNAARLHYLLEELRAGRFWFGAGKTKGLGQCRVEMETPLGPPTTLPKVSAAANHLQLTLSFTGANPLLVGWSWGKVDPVAPAFAALDGRLLLEGMRKIPAQIRERLVMAIGGPIVSAEDWKRQLAAVLPRAIAAWLKGEASQSRQVWQFPSARIKKLGKGKHPLSKRVVAALEPLVDKPFVSREAAEQAFAEALGPNEAKKARRVLDTLTSGAEVSRSFPTQSWDMLVQDMGLAASQSPAAEMEDDDAFQAAIGTAIQAALPALYAQVDQQVHLLESDPWVDQELAERRDHLQIKKMLLRGDINEQQWGEPQAVPEGIQASSWRSFLAAHPRVNYRVMRNPRNLDKSIVNDENMIAFLELHRMRTRQELSQPSLIDFRGGGEGNRDISRKHGKPYDTVFMRMLVWSPAGEGWEVYIPGATVKGAFRKKAAQILRGVWGEGARADDMLDRLFGVQGQRGLALFSDAYLRAPDRDHNWCSMDGVKTDPYTGKPVEEAKSDYLFAYGKDLEFQIRIDMQDLSQADEQAFHVFALLLEDFRRGDIPLGGQKGTGFGWVAARIDRLLWLEGPGGGLAQRWFGRKAEAGEGIWQGLHLDRDVATKVIQSLAHVEAAAPKGERRPPKADEGFISHRAFGGQCGTLFLEGEVLTPIHVRESGEPSYHTVVGGQRVNGWDFFALAPPESAQRPADRPYSLPSKSLRGMIRQIYAIASRSDKDSAHLSGLNPADSLFGWVGTGPDQALMGRVAFDFGVMEQPELAWFKIPYPYGHWQYRNGQWQEVAGASVKPARVAGRWRIYPHAPAAPCVVRLADFEPDSVQADYLRAALTGTRLRFSVRFWNLEREELERLVWCLVLEDGLAHKLGKARQIGLGSFRLRLSPESFLIDWHARASGQPEARWRKPLSVDQWCNPKVVEHLQELRRALDARAL